MRLTQSSDAGMREVAIQDAFLGSLPEYEGIVNE